MSQTIIIDSRVKSQSLDSLIKLYTPASKNPYFNLEAGLEHYRLLAFISNQLKDNSTIYDLGTYKGFSALALSANKNVNVITYDIVDVENNINMTHIPNIKFVTKDAYLDVDKFINSPVIMLDIDPHDGIQETNIINKLVEVRYKGIVICDDIHLNQGMKLFWTFVPAHLTKYDITDLGHASGTGLIVFDKNYVSVEIEDV